MSVRSGLIGLGIGGAFLVGGGFSLYEGFNSIHQENVDKACLRPENIGKLVCEDRLSTPDIISAEGSKGDALLWMGAVSLIGGTFGTAYSYYAHID